jgi:hypothetical protein
MDTTTAIMVLPHGKPRKIPCACGKAVQTNSMPIHVQSKKHKHIMAEKNKIRVEAGTFVLGEIKASLDIINK